MPNLYIKNRINTNVINAGKKHGIYMNKKYAISNKKISMEHLRKFSLICLLFFAAIFSFAQTNLGTTTIGTTIGNRSAGNIEAYSPFTTTNPLTAYSFVMYQYKNVASGKMKVGLYKADGTAGAPGTLQYVSEVTLIKNTSDGWVTYNLTPFQLPAGSYWISFIFDSSNQGLNSRGEKGSHYYKLNTNLQHF